MNNSVFRMIKHLFKIDKQYMLVSLIAIPVGIINPIIDIYFLQKFLQCVSEGKSISGALLVLATMFILNLINLLWDGYASNIYMPIHEKRISMTFKKNVIETISQYDVEKFDDPDFYDLFVLSADEADRRCIGIWKSCVNFLSLFTAIGTIITLIVTTDPYLIIFAVISAIIGLIPQLIKAKTSYEYKNQKVSLDRQEGYIGRILYDKSFIYDAKCSDINNVLKKQLNICVEKGIELIKKFSHKNMTAENVQSLIVVLFTMATWLYLGIRIIFGFYTIASFTSMFNACNSFRNNIREFVSVISEFKSHKLYSDKVYSFFDNKSSDDKESGIEVHFDYQCEFKNVSFSYPQKKELALDNVNLTIKKGEKIAIVGRNGAGKSTLIKLLLHFYEPTNGTILMDDVLYGNIKESSLRKCFSCCFQNMTLYSVTLGENIAMSTDYSEKDINTILHRVNMDKYSNCLDFQVNRDYDNEGLVFSGGEAQKVGIARLLYQKSDILVFDEANSSLDPIAEKELNDLIYDVAGEKTTIFISHRLSTAIKADRILYMDKGKILESGTHDELIQKNGAYAKLYNAQIEQLKTNK